MFFLTLVCVCVCVCVTKEEQFSCTTLLDKVSNLFAKNKEYSIYRLYTYIYRYKKLAKPGM